MVTVKVDKFESKGNEFPKMMIIDDETIVLFLRPKKGTVLNSNKYKPGTVSEWWDMNQFKDVPKGFSVTITQE